MALEGTYQPSSLDFVRDQVALYESSAGTRGNTLAFTREQAGPRGTSLDDVRVPVVVVTMRGARSGSIRKIPLVRVEHSGRYALVASVGGAPRHPGWYFNLVSGPDEVTVQDGPVPVAMTVREVVGRERRTWWDRAVAAFPPYAEYQQRTERTIPVFVATPTAPGQGIR